jgi:hypothetical protein
MRPILGALALVAFLEPGIAGAAQTAHGIVDFYNVSNFGILGVGRTKANLANAAITVLQPDKTLTIAGRTTRTFYLNTDTDGTQANINRSTTYAMVLMFVAFPNSLLKDKPILTVHRNEYWWRDGCSARGTGCFDEGGVDSPPPSYDSTLPDKLILARTQNDRSAVDRGLGVNFDGYAEETQLNSWDLRSFWNRKTQDESICRAADTFCMVKYYLLRFTPRDNPTGQKPLIFDAEFWSATAASIYVQSATNGDYFYKHYTLTLTDD